MRFENAYHEGELYVQQRLGEVEEGRRNGRAVSDSILKGALKYIEQQQLAVFGSVDDEGNVWAGCSLLPSSPTHRVPAPWNKRVTSSPRCLKS